MYMCVRSYQVMSSCFCCFLVEDGSTASFTQNSSKGRCVHFFAMAAVVHICTYCCMKQGMEKSV